MLRREKKIGAELMEELMGWRPSRFSVHAGNRPAGDDRKNNRS